MSHLITGVAVVTTHTPGGSVGITASSFTSVSLEPPTVLVCLNAAGRAYTAILATDNFAVNILGGSQAWVAHRFATPGLSNTERFRDLDLRVLSTGCPVIEGSVACLDCLTRQVHRVGTHGIFIGEVIAAAVDPGHEAPLAYYRRSLEPFRIE